MCLKEKSVYKITKDFPLTSTADSHNSVNLWFWWYFNTWWLSMPLTLTVTSVGNYFLLVSSRNFFWIKLLTRYFSWLYPWPFYDMVFHKWYLFVSGQRKWAEWLCQKSDLAWFSMNAKAVSEIKSNRSQLTLRDKASYFLGLYISLHSPIPTVGY